MATSLLGHSSDMARRISAGAEHAVQFLSRPACARRLRQGLILLFCLWGVLALTRLIWALLPASDGQLPAADRVINPVTQAAATVSAPGVDVARVQSWHLFGEAGAVTPEQATAQADVPVVREGIEKGARETRLNLKLRGVVASSEEGLGFAIIEQNSRQEIYAVEDKLPVQGEVTLAKVMRGRVVLDNSGTYELLELFDDSELDAQSAALPMSARAGTRSVARPEQGNDTSAAAVARGYRERLYENPQSLADVVTVSAVRDNGQLLGYRIAPGKEQEQFRLLGFKPGDLVTSVNGIALDNPANTLTLYQSMRSASEATFELQRDGASVTVSVSLGDPGDGT